MQHDTTNGRRIERRTEQKESDRGPTTAKQTQAESSRAIAAPVDRSDTFTAPPDPSTTDTVSRVLVDARNAVEAVSHCTQREIDALVRGIGRATYDDSRRLAELAVDETRIGNVPDKIAKIERTVLGALDDFGDAPSIGVVRDDDVIEIAKPIGVIAALTPSTNPISTVAFLSMCAIKGGNAVVFSPSPTTTRCIRRLVHQIHAELDGLEAPRELVQLVPGAVTKTKTRRLVENADFVQVTGSHSNVEMGQLSGTPNYCVGAGNVVAFVDESASLPETARTILTGATFDDGAPCTSENGIVVHRSVATEFEALLEHNGGYFCSPDRIDALRTTLFPDDGGLDRDLVARPAIEIASRAGFEVPADTRVLLVRPETVGPADPLSGEKLSVVVAFYEVPTFEAGIDLIGRILNYEGAGHSSVLHTNDETQIETFAREIDVCRAVVNQPSTALAGSYDNDLPHSVVLGGGTWAGNQLDENLTYHHFITSTRIAKRSSRAEPRADALLGREPNPDPVGLRGKWRRVLRDRIRG